MTWLSLKPSLIINNYSTLSIFPLFPTGMILQVYIYILYIIIEGSLEVKLPTIWRDEKAVSREKSQKRKDQKKEDAGARKGRKVAKNCVFSWFCGSGGLKNRLAKAAGAEPAGEMRDEKVHAVVARSTFRSQNVQNTPGSDHFWKLRCRKSARRCGAKHMSKSKCTKHTRFRPLLEIEMLKKCTSLWCEAHFQVKMYKTRHVRATFGGSDLEKVHAVVAWSTFRSQNVQNTRGSDHFWRFRCCFASLRVITLHYYTLHYTTVHYTTLHSTTLQLQLQNYTTTLHYIKLQYTTPHYTTLHYTTLHYTTLYTPLHYITLHHTLHTLQYITLHYTPQDYNYNYRTTQLHSITLHYTPLH